MLKPLHNDDYEFLRVALDLAVVLLNLERSELRFTLLVKV
jgi:hypothetical protein